MSKRIVDIPDRTYDFIMRLNQHTFGSKYAHKDVQSDIVKAVKESKPYDDSGDLISRSALKEQFEKAEEQADTYEMLVEFHKQIIDNAQTVSTLETCNICTSHAYSNGYADGYSKGKTDSRSKGIWYGDGSDYTCSVCKHSLLEVANSQDYIEFDTPNFCPNCGADMRGGAE